MEKGVLAIKFGGTSVATPERRQAAVAHVRREWDAGRKVALVVSATGRRGDPYATDTLLDLLRGMGGPIDPRNYSFLFVTGEMISVALMVQALSLAGIPAAPLTGGMAGIVTDDFAMSAHVVATDNTALCTYLQRGVVPVVCGGQGVTASGGDFAILGRDSSDTSGVIVGAMIGADRVDIYTDVEYIHAADPLVVQAAPRRSSMSYAAALEMARYGAKVIKAGAVETAMTHGIPIRVRSTFSDDPGTLIGAQPDAYALVGLPMLPSVRIARVQQDMDAGTLAALEQHVGLLRLVDTASGEMLLCTPSGDTAGMVDRELARNGVQIPTWQPDQALLSLIGVEGAMAAMKARADKALAHAAIACPYCETGDRRVTYVVSSFESRAALLAVYEELSEYLGERNTTQPTPDE